MNSTPQDREPRHPIRVVARRTGLTPAVLRAWERRYKVVEPSRSEGGQRLYSDLDVRRLAVIAQALEGRPQHPARRGPQPGRAGGPGHRGRGSPAPHRSRLTGARRHGRGFDPVGVRRGGGAHGDGRAGQGAGPGGCAVDAEYPVGRRGPAPAGAHRPALGARRGGPGHGARGVGHGAPVPGLASRHHGGGVRGAGAGVRHACRSPARVRSPHRRRGGGPARMAKLLPRAGPAPPRRSPRRPGRSKPTPWPCLRCSPSTTRLCRCRSGA